MDMHERAVARLEGHVVEAALALRREYLAAMDDTENPLPIIACRTRAVDEAVTGLLEAIDDLAELLCERP